MEKLLPVLFSTAFFNIPRSGALEREKFVERKKEEEEKKLGKRWEGETISTVCAVDV